MKKVLITGFNGFVGTHACKEFKLRGFEIVGLTNIELDSTIEHGADSVIVCDLTQPDSVRKLNLEHITHVLNLAGFATNTGGDEELVKRINIGVHVNLYARIKELGLNPRIVAVSSGTVYTPDQTLPISEEGILKDPAIARPYEASKILMEEAVQSFIDAGMDVVIARPFNHAGPGQGPGFIVPDFIRQITSAIKEEGSVSVGSLHTKRDYSDVRDVVRAYADILEGQGGERVYNICASVSHTGQEILDILMGELCKDFTPEVTIDQAKIRPGEAEDFRGSYEKLQRDFGWSPHISFEQTIIDAARAAVA